VRKVRRRLAPTSYLIYRLLLEGPRSAEALTALVYPGLPGRRHNIIDHISYMRRRYDIKISLVNDVYVLGSPGMIWFFNWLAGGQNKKN